ncbi:MAG: hypothetical protein LBU64_03290 [Planctomycetota bacterium]|jgi:hypothetical protein|nr:hypothetical protein [Planctomycetota bacterium]
MAFGSWNWKDRNAGGSGLLYEPGNWGDLLKLSWLAAILRWKGRKGVSVYFDPFAGDVGYPLSGAGRARFNQAGADELDLIKKPFVEAGNWPSAATLAGRLPVGRRLLFDSDPEKRGRWARTPGVEVLAGESGWAIAAARRPEADELWLLDPYDFLADWQKFPPPAPPGSGAASVLLYLYNRSAENSAIFSAYREFCRWLKNSPGGRKSFRGRLAADAFLPRAHHEMHFLPGRADAERNDFSELSAVLKRLSLALAAAQAGEAIFTVL